MKFSSDEIASVLQAEIEHFDSKVDVSEVGTVLEVGDGIARVYGLAGVMAGEMVEFANGAIGLAFNLEETSVGVIILGDYLTIQEGDEVKSLGTLLSVPAGDAVIGRVLDPLGSVYENFVRIQEQDQDYMLKQALRSIGTSVQVIDLELRHSRDEQISLSWHLTALERKRVLWSIESAANQDAFSLLVNELRPAGERLTVSARP